MKDGLDLFELISTAKINSKTIPNIPIVYTKCLP